MLNREAGSPQENYSAEADPVLVYWTLEQLEERLVREYRVREDGLVSRASSASSVDELDWYGSDEDFNHEVEMYVAEPNVEREPWMEWPLARYFAFIFKERITCGHAIHMASADPKGAQVVSVLLNLDADPNDDGATPLSATPISNRDLNLMEGLCESFRARASGSLSGGDSKRDPKLKTLRPLHLAAGTGDVETIRLLVSFRANVNARTTLGELDDYTALHEAAYFGRYDAVDVLVEVNAEVNAVNRKTETALHVVAQSEHANNWLVAKHLIKAQIDVTLGNFESRTALMIASHTSFPSSKLSFLMRRCIGDVIRVAMVDPATTLDVLGRESKHGTDEKWKRALCKPQDSRDTPTYKDLVTLINLAPSVAAEILEFLTISPTVMGSHAYYHPIPRHSRQDPWCTRRCQYVEEDTWSTLRVGTVWSCPTWHDILAPSWRSEAAASAKDVHIRRSPLKALETANPFARFGLTQRTRVEVKMLKMPNAINLQVIYALSETDSMVLFRTPAIQAILDCVWVELVCPWYTAHFVLRTLELAILVVISVITPPTNELRDALWSFVTVTAVREAVMELRQAWSYHIKLNSYSSYLWLVYQKFDIVPMVSLLCLAFVAWGFENDGDMSYAKWVRSRRLLAVVSVQRWIQLLRMLCSYSVFDLGYSLIPLIRSIPKVGGMTIIAIFFLVAFAQAFAALDEQNPCVRPQRGSTLPDDCNSSAFADYITEQTFLNSFRLLVLSDGAGIDWLVNLSKSDDDHAGGTSFFAHIALYVSVTVFCIFILNLYIAVHGQAYQEASSIVTESFYARRAQVVLGPLLNSCWFPRAVDVVGWPPPLRQIFFFVLERPTWAYLIVMSAGIACWLGMLLSSTSWGSAIPTCTLLFFVKMGDQILLRRPMRESACSLSPLTCVEKDNVLSKVHGDAERYSGLIDGRRDSRLKIAKEWLKDSMQEHTGTRPVQITGDPFAKRGSTKRARRVQAGIQHAAAEELYLWWCAWDLDNEMYRHQRNGDHVEVMERLDYLETAVHNMSHDMRLLLQQAEREDESVFLGGTPTSSLSRSRTLSSKVLGRSTTRGAAALGALRSALRTTSADVREQPMAESTASVTLWARRQSAGDSSWSMPKLVVDDQDEGLGPRGRSSRARMRTLQRSTASGSTTAYRAEGRRITQDSIKRKVSIDNI